ncbi:hypothetical protein ES705_17632 [subsurface metagenome]
MGLKKSDVTRMAIKKFIEEYGDNEEKPYANIKHLLGIVESGLPDLGQHHRNYLLKRIKGNEDK